MDAMHPAEVVALGYRYPTPDALESLTAAVERSLRGVTRRRMDDFLASVGRLDLGAWEELHTRTLDLSPAFVPYVGHVTWGENYRRGEFMADLKREMRLVGVDLAGELPDHIEPILRYVARATRPLTDLLDVLGGAVAEMASTLKAADRDNPYRHLIAATLAVVEDLKPVVIGVS
jgi:nitrate reductase molybdenum cofactor assembly chaperone NarJ/NarW